MHFVCADTRYLRYCIFFNITLPKDAPVCLALLLKVPGSNIDRDTGYSD
jgi:hypothetical protein